MTIAFLMLAFGLMVAYGGWTNRSVWALTRGDNTTVKAAAGTSAAAA